MASALLWMTHVWNNELEAEFERILKTDDPGSLDVWLILDARTPGAPDLARRYRRCLVINEEELFGRLPYSGIARKGLHYNVHFPLLDFYLIHPAYEYYWMIEFDVRYTGAWGPFLGSFAGCNHDLITSHIRRFHEEPRWWWWDSLCHPEKNIDRQRYIRSFNVVYRISNRALALIHGAHRDGWQGHPEVVLPTLLSENGCTLLDFGGDGEFIRPGKKNTCYTSNSTRDGIPSPFCTMRWRPSATKAGIRRNRLYHPVKPAAMVEPAGERIRFFLHWTRNWLAENLRRRTRAD